MGGVARALTRLTVKEEHGGGGGTNEEAFMRKTETSSES